MMSHIPYKVPHYLPLEQFQAQVKTRLAMLEASSTALTIIALDVDNFNYVNDLFGYEAGDLALEAIKNHFDDILEGEDIFCNVHTDHFAFCLHARDAGAVAQCYLKLTDLSTALSTVLPDHYSVVISGGLLMVADNKLPLSALLDKANFARKKTKGNSVTSFLFYDEKMSEEVSWQKQITLMMDSALKNREFEMYLQPKLFLKTGQIVGAEALVRWNSPQLGFVAPDRFISIMEQNGFIRQLDFFMLGEACRFLNESHARGVPQLPISVNFSKAHLQEEKLADSIFHTVNQAGISTHLIEIEFTESVFFSNLEKLIEIVTDLKLLGFRVSMDDFGTACSSLNSLKALPVDIIKIDKGFLNAASDTDKGKLIITKVVELIKSLRMLSVMEGIEEVEQVEFLQKLSCDLGQGFFYARPMPRDQYVRYLQQGSTLLDVEHFIAQEGDIRADSPYANTIPQAVQLDNWELSVLGKNIDIGLMKGYLDGEAAVQYVNDRALEYLGYSRQEFREIFHNSIGAFTFPEDAHIVQENAKQLVANGKPIEFQTRALRKDGKIIVLKGRVSCILDPHGRPIGIYAFQDVTEELAHTSALQLSLENKILELEKTVISERKVKEELRLSEERYRVVIEQSDDILFEWDFITDCITFSAKYSVLFGLLPLTEQVSISQRIRACIHPEDLPAFEAWINNTFRKSGQSSAQYRIQHALGHYYWMNCLSTAICDPEGVPLKAVGVFTNISDQKEQLDDLTQKAQLDPLTKLLNKRELNSRTEASVQSGLHPSGAFFMVDIDNFKGINDNLGHQLGDNVLMDIARKLRNIFPERSILGRIGGDEFSIYLPAATVAEAFSKAEALSNALHLSYYGAMQRYDISGSIGIAMYPEHGKSFEALYRCADAALYHAKKSGKDQVVLYQSEIEGALQDIRTPVEYAEGFLNTYFQNDIAYHIFAMLYETKDIPATVQMILELLGTTYQVDRTYVFQHNHHLQNTSNTYEWCAPGIPSEIENLKNLPLESLETYFNAYSDEGVFSCNDVRQSPTVVYTLCQQQGIKSLLHCGLVEAGVFTGFIGFDSCAAYHSWSGEEIAILGYISRILSVFLLRTDAGSEIEEDSCLN